jgi:hypothetical protein
MRAKEFVQINRLVQLGSLDPVLLHKLTQDPSPLFQYLGHYYLYRYYASDEGTAALYRQAMHELEPQLPKVVQAQMEKELAERRDQGQD